MKVEPMYEEKIVHRLNIILVLMIIGFVLDTFQRLASWWGS